MSPNMYFTEHDEGIIHPIPHMVVPMNDVLIVCGCLNVTFHIVSELCVC